MDPRVKAPPAELQKKFDLEMHLASTVTQSSQAVMQARSVQEQLKKSAESANGRVSDSVKALEGKVSTLLDGPKDADAYKSEPALKASNSTAIALFTGVEKSDAEPTSAQSVAFAKLNTDV